jgi:hypothetical protein
MGKKEFSSKTTIVQTSINVWSQNHASELKITIIDLFFMQ